MDNRDGSESEDMDMSDGSSKDQFGGRQVSSKRKLDDPVDGTGAAKRPKTDDASQPVPSPMDKVPDSVLQRMFMLLPPAMLFRCNRVCRRFKHVLEEYKNVPVRGRSRRDPAAHLVDSEVVWISSRRLTYPFLPRPLPGFSEAQMLRLVTQQTCQNCKTRFPHVKATHALNGGPGTHGVRTIWPFRLAVCGRCLLQLTLTDVELLQERNPLPAGALRRGIAYAFLSKDLHVVSEQNARTNINQGISKIFLLDDIKSITAEYIEAKVLGEGAAEEWIKGLDEKGKQSMSDALRWSRWEDSLPLGTNLKAHMMELDPSSFNSTSPDGKHNQALGSIQEPQTPMHPLPRPVQAEAFSQEPPQAHNTVPEAGPPVTKDQLPVRHPRDPREVQEIQRLRREDIERRCMQLQPPLVPDVLQYSNAYKAALQISMPMSDMAWEQLRPRIEKDREFAEKAHYERTQQLAYMRAAAPTSTSYANVYPAYHNKEEDREWEAARGPLRKKLGDAADDLINRKWLRAQLDELSAPVFAAEVLTHVQTCFFEDCKQQGDATPAATLALDDLRWVFDHKIRPLAERHCRELFVCSGCFTDKEIRWFAFEGLIQHYGAKHTTDFSQGNIVVHWQSAQWPEESPFVTDLSKIIRQDRRSSYNPNARPHKDAYRSHQHQEWPVVDRYAAQDKLLSENPLFSQGYDTAPNLKTALNDQRQVENIAKGAAEVWKALAGVNDLLDSIRVQTVLQVIKARYGEVFGTYMPIEAFTKALTVDKRLTELKAANMLGCRFCEPSLEATGKIYFERIAKKGAFILSSLLTHYKINHMKDHVDPSVWSNLIDLPDKSQILDLLKTPGMTDSKLELISLGFPGVFPIPLPRIDIPTEPEPESILTKRLIGYAFGGPAAPKSKKKKVNNKSSSAHAAFAAEYDPRNPKLPDQKKDDDTILDLSKFDTDAQRPPSIAQAAVPAPGNAQITITPETLAAINSLQNVAAGMSQQAQPERLPSPYRTQIAAPAPSQAAVVPDIAAIIEAMRQTQHAAQTTAAVPSAPSYHAHMQQASGPPAHSPSQLSSSDTYGHGSYAPAPAPVPPHWHPETRGWSDSYVPPQYVTAAYEPGRHQAPAQHNGQDLLAALAQNSRAFNHGSQYDPAHYGQARPPAPPALQYGQGQQQQQMQYADHSAPRPVFYTYPNQAWAPAQPIQPAMVPQGHQTNPQAQGTVYIDEHGRRFTYID